MSCYCGDLCARSDPWQARTQPEFLLEPLHLLRHLRLFAFLELPWQLWGRSQPHGAMPCPSRIHWFLESCTMTAGLSQLTAYRVHRKTMCRKCLEHDAQRFTYRHVQQRLTDAYCGKSLQVLWQSLKIWVAKSWSSYCTSSVIPHHEQHSTQQF